MHAPSQAGSQNQKMLYTYSILDRQVTVMVSGIQVAYVQSDLYASMHVPRQLGLQYTRFSTRLYRIAREMMIETYTYVHLSLSLLEIRLWVVYKHRAQSAKVCCLSPIRSIYRDSGSMVMRCLMRQWYDRGRVCALQNRSRVFYLMRPRSFCMFIVFFDISNPQLPQHCVQCRFLLR